MMTTRTPCPWPAGPWHHFSVSCSPSIGSLRTTCYEDHGWETYADFDLWIGLTGFAKVQFDNAPAFDFEANQVVLVPPDLRIRLTTNHRKPIEMAWCHFDCFAGSTAIRQTKMKVDVVQQTLSLPNLPTLSLVAQVPARRLVQQLLSHRLRFSDDLAHLQLNIELMKVLYRLRQTHVRPQDIGVPQRSPIDLALVYIQDHHGEQLTLQDISRHAGISVPTLTRLFRRQLNTSPGRYLIQVRMARASDLLLCLDFRISEVAHVCGYNSLAFFSRAFKAEFGLSPTAFRHQYWGNP